MWVYIMMITLLATGLTNVKVCDSSGKLSVQLLKFHNKQHKLKDGSCCDNIYTCINSCDNYFFICVTEIFKSKCNLGRLKTKVLGDDQITFPGIGGDLGNGNKNPLVFNFSAWKGLALSVEIWDYEEDRTFLGDDDFVDSISLDIPNTPDPDPQSAHTNRKLLKSNTSPRYRYLDLNVKVYCDNNFLVPDCSRECIARDDDDRGHYTCDYVNGRMECYENWYGDRCTKYCSPRNDSYAHYACDSSGEKNCSANWFGGNCSKYCKEKDDETGHYDCEEKSGGEICLAHWFGEDCLTFCDGRDGVEGHYTCNPKTGGTICLQDWFGVNCTKHCLPQDDTLLGHFTCDVITGNKACLSGWHGVNCTRRIDSTVTVNNLDTPNIAHNTSSLHSVYTKTIPQTARETSALNSNSRTRSAISTVLSVTKENRQFNLRPSDDHVATPSASTMHSIKFSSMSWHTTKILSSVTIHDAHTKKYNSLSSFQNTATVLSFDKDLHTSTTISIRHSSFIVARDINTRNTEATTLTSTAAMILGVSQQYTTVTGKHSYLQTQEKKPTFISVVPTTTNVPRIASLEYSSPLNILSMETKSLARSTENTHAVLVSRVFPSLSQSSISTTTLHASASVRFLTPPLKSSYQSSIAFSHGMTGINDSGSIPGKSTMIDRSPVSLVESKNMKSMSGNSTNVLTVSLSRSQLKTTNEQSVFVISPSSVVKNNVFTSSLTTQTIKFILHLQTNWHQDNKTQFELLLKHHLKTAYSNEKEINVQYFFEEARVTTIQKCSNMVVLYVKISFMKARSARISTEQGLQHDIEMIIERTFNTSEIILRNDTDDLVINCHKLELKKQQRSKNKLAIILVTVLLMCLLFVVLFSVAVQKKIKKRAQLSTKVHPECYSHEVPRIPMTRTDQNLLYLEDL